MNGHRKDDQPRKVLATFRPTFTRFLYSPPRHFQAYAVVLTGKVRRGQPSTRRPFGIRRLRVRGFRSRA
jgi:hypothetical protein